MNGTSIMAPAVAAVPNVAETKSAPEAEAAATAQDKPEVDGASTPITSAEVIDYSVVDAVADEEPMEGNGAASSAPSGTTNGNGRQRSRSICKSGFVTRLEPIAEQVRPGQNVEDHEEDDDEEEEEEKKETENAALMRRKERSGSITAAKNAHDSEEDDERIMNEGNPFITSTSSPTKAPAADIASHPRDSAGSMSLVLSRSLLSSEMALQMSTSVAAASTVIVTSTPTEGADDATANVSSLVSASQGFAEHSAIRRPSLTPRNDGTSSTSTATNTAHAGTVGTTTSVSAAGTGGGGNGTVPSALSSSYIAMATISNPVLTNPTQKSVSFSQTNLAIDSDNNVRPCAANQPIIPNVLPPLPVLSNSVSTLAPPAPSVPSPRSPRGGNGNGNISNGSGIGAGNISPTRMPAASTVSPISAATTSGTSSTTSNTAPTASGLANTGPSLAAAATMNGPMSLSSSIIRGDIHMEIAKLSAKTFEKQSSQVMSASMRHYSSLSSVAMSHRMSSLHSGGLAVHGGVGTSNSSSATSEASQQMLMMTQQEALLQQELTEKAVVVIRRVLDKLNGLDFASHWDPSSSNQQLQVADQVDRLIQEATSNENLSQSFFGWCPFW